jgi:hypothetical protein
MIYYLRGKHILIVVYAVNDLANESYLYNIIFNNTLKKHIQYNSIFKHLRLNRVAFNLLKTTHNKLKPITNVQLCEHYFYMYRVATNMRRLCNDITG